MKTAIVLSCLLAGSSITLQNTSFKPSHSGKTHYSMIKAAKRDYNPSKPVGPVRIIVDKSSYELYVYDSQGWFATYPVVFGNSSLDDKKMEGDKNTPEGSFRIVNKRVHDKWDRYMGLDYPTRESLDKFNARKKRGEIPASASPGGGIGIHGTWPHEDYQIDRFKNWTNGCISLKNDDVKDLYSYVPIGTPISIRK
ncbi:MAG: L,D-transpeptidase family protein [Flavisolibacter sp.]